ncbi:MAG: hypothetical protein JNM37_14065 [Rhodocyclaceae bacterium]|nr:hypothetical protein [Rhodocyclaceae bacterium]
MKLLKNTRKKVVTLAVASALGGVAMMSAPAHAMNLAQDGKGEVLLFPYYTVKNGFDTLLSVVNTSDRTTLFKIRFREARNSREVRDFNVALSPHDVWTGGVTVNGGGALFRTFDKSCTSPDKDQWTAGPSGSFQVDFTAIGYNGSDPLYPYDNGGQDAGRVQEGYLEIIEMAHSTVPESSITSASVIEFATQHVSGTPRACATFDAAFNDPTNLVNSTTGSGVFSTFTAPANVLVGSATLINIASGQAYEATPTAVQAFQDTSTILFPPGDNRPSLATGEAAPTAYQFLNSNANLGTTGQTATAITEVVVPASVEAVSALLSADSLINEYASGSTDTSSAKTSWVVTFPTKHHYTDEGLTAAQPPFANLFPPTGRSCDTVSWKYWDREEATKGGGGKTVFSPAPSGQPADALCYEVNVLTFNGGDIFGTTVPLNVVTTDIGTAGWMRLTLTSPTPWAATGATLSGLPTIGFSVIERNNSVDAGNNRNYGSGQPHAKETRLSGAL